MTKGSENSGSKTVATIGNIYCGPVETTVSSKGAKGGGGEEGSYETKSRISYDDKQTGCYGRAATGEFHWKNGTSGVKSEYKKSSTVRTGDKGGYTEVYREQTVRHVSYNKSSSSSKNLVTYDYGDGGYGSAGSEGGGYGDGGYGSAGSECGGYGDGGYGSAGSECGGYGYGYDSD